VIARVDTAFEEVCSRLPSKTAVQSSGSRITYQELRAGAEKVREALTGAVSGEKEITAILMDAGIHYVASILGVMGAGHVFMPVDMSFPPKRLMSIFRRSRPRFFLVPERHEEAFKGLIGASESIHITSERRIEALAGEKGRLHLYALSYRGRGKDLLGGAEGQAEGLPDDACYVMATSGSTGEPKLILGSHKGLSHFIGWEIGHLGLSPEVRGSFLSHVTFDVSLRDIFTPLLAGGTVCIPDQETLRVPKRLLTWIEQQEVTLVHMVPTLLRAVLNALRPRGRQEQRLPCLRDILIGGEPLFGIDISNWRDRINTTTRLINVYGPSETTLAKLFYEIGEQGFQPQEMIPIGRPLPDTQVLILDQAGRLCPPGQVGEIHIKTPYRSLGYLNPSLEETQAFVPDPIHKESDEPLYRTGDLGKLLDAEVVLFMGRRDDQVKLNGVRVQLGEVEAVLGMHPMVRQAAAALKKDRFGHERLLAYIVPGPQGPTTTQELRRHMQEHLPDFMIPSRFVFLDRIPLTPSNKIDRRALPGPSRDRPILEQEYVPPRSQTERRLARIWSRVLDLETVGANDGFFELGGTSLLSMHLIALIHEEFGVEIPLTTIFQYPTLGMLARYLEAGSHPTGEELGAEDRAQKRRAARMRARSRRAG